MPETQPGETNFRSHRNRDQGAAANSLVIGPGDSLVGTLTFDGEVRVQGLLEGALKVTGDVTLEGTADAFIACGAVVTGS